MSGNRLGEYEILDQLGEGGMGAVYRARHERLDRLVALKVLRPGSVSDPEHERRFQREMTLAGGLSHPNLVRILDGGSIDGTAFIAMELVDGLTITTVVNRWAPLPWPVALAIGSRVLDGLAFLHERSILHRDIKPSNILLSQEGYVKLLDFGLARGHGATVMTQEGAVVGTLQFLSPEVLTGEDADAGSDLWAVGCVMYLMLAGRMHVMAEEFNDWVQSIVNDPIAPPGVHVPTIPAAASQLVARCLSRDPRQRPGTAAVMRDEIDRILEEVGQTSWDRVLIPGLLGALDQGRCVVATPPAQMTAALDAVPEAESSGSADRLAPSGAGPELAQSTPRSVRLPSRSGSRPALRPPTRGSAGAPVPVKRRLHPVLLALPSVLAAVFAVYFLKPPSRPPEPAPSADAISVARPAPADSPAPLDPRIKSGFARHLTAYLPRLRAGGGTARRTVEELRRMSPIDFGGAADNWIHWIEFEPWIAAGGKTPPPRYANAETGLLNYVDERMALSWLTKLGSGLTAPLIATAYRGVGGSPDDGRCWLAMGRVFELEGRARDAVFCYAFGLPRLEGVDWRDTNELIWTALARALELVPGRALERDWYAYLPRTECRRAWVGLKDALKGSDPQRLERMLRAGLANAAHRDMATVMLGQVMVEVNNDPTKARRIWTEALDSVGTRSNRELVFSLFYFLCLRGHFDDVRALAGRTGRDNMLPVVDYLAGNVQGARLPWKEETRDGAMRLILLRLEIFRQLELGHVTDAEGLAEVLHDDGHAVTRDHASLLLELVGQGTTHASTESDVGKMLSLDPPDIGLWNDAAGALSTPSTLRIMNQWNAQPASVGEQTEGWRELIRGVWLSRRGKHAEALDALARACDRYGATGVMPGVEVCEVLARPLLDDRLGIRQEQSVLDRASGFALPGCFAGTIVESYLRALRAGAMDRARNAARVQFEVTPRAHFWPLAWTLHERIAGRRADEAVARARLASAVRWHGCGLWALRAASR